MRIPHITLLLATVCLVTANDSHKRVPSGFTGVRGKKSIPDSEYASSQEFPEKPIPVGYSDTAGKKIFDGWTDKRAPTSGFFGMRGKKEAENDFYKRAPNGFFGMRGKKEFNPFDEEASFEKRAPAGFLGMRGKKDNEFLDNGYFDTPDKKQPARAGFFGMRGKKYPYEFRGKFVGVRGKKASEEANRDYADLMQQVGKDLDINQLMLLLTANEPYKNTVGYQDFNSINN